MPAKSTASDIAERAMRSTLLTLSHRRSLGRLATRTPITRPMVRRFICARDARGGAAGHPAPPRRGHADDRGRPGRVRQRGGRRPRRRRALRGGAGRPCRRRPGPQRVAQAHPDGAGHRPRARPRDHRRHRRQGGGARRLRAHRHGGPHHDRQHAGPVAGRPADDLAGRRRGRRARDPVGAAAQRRRHRGDHRRGRTRPAVQGRVQGARERRLPGQGRRGRGLRAADAAPHARRPLPGDRHPRREADQACRRGRQGRGDREGRLRVPDAVRRAPGHPGAAGRRGLDGPHLRPVRLAVVPVLHAPPRGATRRTCRSSCATCGGSAAGADRAPASQTRPRGGPDSPRPAVLERTGSEVPLRAWPWVWQDRHPRSGRPEPGAPIMRLPTCEGR